MFPKAISKNTSAKYVRKTVIIIKTMDVVCFTIFLELQIFALKIRKCIIKALSFHKNYQKIKILSAS